MARGGKRDGAGRPAGSPNKHTAERRAALADLVGDHVQAAIKALADIAKGGQSEAARVSAATAILDRVYGRPGTSVSVDWTDATERPTEVVISAAAWPITDEAQNEIDAHRGPDGAIDFAALSDRTLDQIIRAADLRDVAQPEKGGQQQHKGGFLGGYASS